MDAQGPKAGLRKIVLENFDCLDSVLSPSC